MILRLFTNRRFPPFFFLQFLGAFNDNLFRSILVVFFTYTLSETYNYSAGEMVAFASLIFMLPFFLFSASGGLFADKYKKTLVIKNTKLFEVIVMLVAAVGFAKHEVGILFIALFLMGAQSALFGPSKYSFLPEILQKKELLTGNAIIETSTFAAILLGTVTGTILVAHKEFNLISVLLVSLAFVGWVLSCMIKETEQCSSQVKIGCNIFLDTYKVLLKSLSSKKIFLIVIAISWFWFLGVILLTHLPVFTKEVLFASENLVIYFFISITSGIFLGAFLCRFILNNQPDTRYAPILLVLIGVFCISLYFSGFIIYQYFFIALSLFVIGSLAGFYIVPLYTCLQLAPEETKRAQLIASNNIFNALFMVFANLLAGSIYFLHGNAEIIFLTAGILTILLGIYLHAAFS